MKLQLEAVVPSLELRAHDAIVCPAAMRFDGDDALIVAHGRDRLVRRLRLDDHSWEALFELEVEADPSLSKLTADGLTLVTAGGGGLRGYDLKDGTELYCVGRAPSSDDEHGAVVMLRGGAGMVLCESVGRFEKRLSGYDSRTGSRRWQFEQRYERFGGIAPSDTGFAMSCSDEIHWLEGDPPAPVKRCVAKLAPSLSPIYLEDARHVVGVTKVKRERQIHCFRRGAQLAIWSLSFGDAVPLVGLTERRLLVYVRSGLKVLSLDDGAVLATLSTARQSYVRCCAVSPGGERVAVATSAGAIVVLSLAT